MSDSEVAGAVDYRSLFECSADAMLIIEDERFVACNEAAVRLLGFPDKQALLERHPSEISPEYQPDGQRSYDKASGILKKMQVIRNQARKKLTPKLDQPHSRELLS